MFHPKLNLTLSLPYLLLSVTPSEVRTDGSCEFDYTLTRTWTAKNRCGLETSHTQILTAKAPTAPQFVQSPLPADATFQCNPPVAATLTAVDDCDSNPTVTPDEARVDGSCPNDYVLTRSWTAKNSCNLVTSHTQIVTVKDTTAPQLAGCPAPVLSIDICTTPVPPSATVTASDNCDAPEDTTETGHDCCFDGSGISRTWTATDQCGNTASCGQTIAFTPGCV
jgi:large repetitive protein